ncbi:unnamed protein product [Durusdinium trenchii]|uniref:Uncharacterized protein n=1 Tax=Durusdinium trenchii TaxID=1381693 RepID=A0ABP0HGN6_9DINO
METLQPGSGPIDLILVLLFASTYLPQIWQKVAADLAEIDRIGLVLLNIQVVVGLGWWLRLTLMGPVEMKTAKRWNSRVLDTAVAEVDDNEGFLSMMILSAVTWLLASIAYVLGTVIDVFLELLRMTVFLLPFGLLLGYLWRFLPSQLLQTALPTLGRAGFFLSIALLYRCLAVLGETQSSETEQEKYLLA